MVCLTSRVILPLGDVASVQEGEAGCQQSYGDPERESFTTRSLLFGELKVFP